MSLTASCQRIVRDPLLSPAQKSHALALAAENALPYPALPAEVTEAMAQGAMDYVASARVAGRGRVGTMLREILPNVLPTIVVLLTLEMGIAVIVEAILSFVNLSISTDQPTWGGMISEGRASVHQAWWVLVFPLITLFLTVLSFSQLGEGLKDRFDPVLR